MRQVYSLVQIVLSLVDFYFNNTAIHHDLQSTLICHQFVSSQVVRLDLHRQRGSTLRVGAVDGVKLVLRDDFVPLVGSLRRFLMALSDLSAHISAADPN